MELGFVKTLVDTIRDWSNGKFLLQSNIAEIKAAAKFKYEDFTPELLAALKGEPGTSVTIMGSLNSVEDLAYVNKVLGLGYLIDGYLWVYTGTTLDDATHKYGFENVGKIQGPSGISIFTSYVFTRSSTKPTNGPLSTQGTFNTPNPPSEGWTNAEGVIWHDGIPTGTDTVYMSSRIFTSTEESPQMASWTAPILLVDTDTLDVCFHPETEDGNAPANPTVHGSLGSDITTWHDSANSNDCWMGISKKTNGIYGPWSIVRIKGEKGEPGTDGEDAKSIITSYVFTRRRGAPTYGPSDARGSYLNPSPGPEGWQETEGESIITWYDGIPASALRGGRMPLYMSYRKFTSDGLSPQDAHWSTPVLMADNDELDVCYHPEKTDKTTPSAPTSHGNQGSDVNTWHEVANTNDVWVAISRKSEGEWSAWSVIRIKGEKGEKGQTAITSYVFKRSSTIITEVPTGGSYTSPFPTSGGWSDGVPSGFLPIYMSHRIFTSDGLSPLLNTWSTPVLLADTADIDFEFSAVTTSPGTPTTNPENWHNTATSADIWMAIRKKVGGSWSDWEVTKIKGEQGIQGATGASAYIVFSSLREIYMETSNGKPLFNKEFTTLLSAFEGLVSVIDLVTFQYDMPENWTVDTTTTKHPKFTFTGSVITLATLIKITAKRTNYENLEIIIPITASDYGITPIEFTSSLERIVLKVDANSKALSNLIFSTHLNCLVFNKPYLSNCIIEATTIPSGWIVTYDSVKDASIMLFNISAGTTIETNSSFVLKCFVNAVGSGIKTEVSSITIPVIGICDGKTPIKGTDYWTAQDRADLKDDVKLLLVSDGVYFKPSEGIPSSDLAGGIPYSKLSSSVLTSLNKADSALLYHQSLYAYAKKTDIPSLTNYALKSEIPDVSAFYTKPSEGIPNSDLAGQIQKSKLASDVRTSLGKADSALQTHQSLASYALKTEISTILSTTKDISFAGITFKNGLILIGDVDNRVLILQGSIAVKSTSGTTIKSATLLPTGVITTSDIRTKEIESNIDLTTELIANAPIFNFNFKGDTKLHSGTSAQYWKEILPNIIEENSEGFLAMNYAQAALVSVVSLAKKVLELENKIKELENK